MSLEHLHIYGILSQTYKLEASYHEAFGVLLGPVQQLMSLQ